MTNKLVFPRFSTGDDPETIAESLKRLLAEWLRRGLEKPGKTNIELARRLGVGPTEVTKMKGGQRKIVAHQLFVISQYIEEPIPGPPGALGENSKQIQIVGEAGRQVWYDTDPDPVADGTMAYEPTDKYAALPHYAVRVVGTDVASCIPEGMFAVYVPYWDARKHLTDKDFVLLKLIRKGDLLHKRLIRQVHVLPDRHELRTAPCRSGGETAPVSAITLADDLQHIRNENGRVEVLGLVVWQCGALQI